MPFFWHSLIKDRLASSNLAKLYCLVSHLLYFSKKLRLYGIALPFLSLPFVPLYMQNPLQVRVCCRGSTLKKVAIIAILYFLGPTLLNMILVLGFFGMVADLRVARANTILYSEREFVLTARALGASNIRIMVKELLPNVIIPVLALAVIGMSRVIVIEGILSFLGVGLPPPEPTWGKMISEGYVEMASSPHITFLPAAAMFFTILSFNLIGDRLRTLTNARTGQI